MRAALAGNHAAKLRVHPLRADTLALAAAGEQLAKRRGFQFLGVHSLPQQVDALPQDRTDARVAPRLDQRSRKRACCSSESEIEDLTATRPDTTR